MIVCVCVCEYSLRRGVSYTTFGYHYGAHSIELQQLDKKCADEEEEK